MKGSRSFRHSSPSIGSLLVVTVTLLAPGTGLMSIPVPDGAPLQNSSIIADYAHPEKKASEEGLLAHLDPTVASFSLPTPDGFGGTILSTLATLSDADAAYTGNIRAPPASHRGYV